MYVCGGGVDFLWWSWVFALLCLLSPEMQTSSQHSLCTKSQCHDNRQTMSPGLCGETEATTERPERCGRWNMIYEHTPTHTHLERNTTRASCYDYGAVVRPQQQCTIPRVFVWRGQVSGPKARTFFLFSLSVAVSSPLRAAPLQSPYVPVFVLSPPTPDAGVLLRGPIGRERDPTPGRVMPPKRNSMY